MKTNNFLIIKIQIFMIRGDIIIKYYQLISIRKVNGMIKLIK